MVLFGKKFHSFKMLTSINDVDIDKTTIYDKLAFDKKELKHCIGYKNDAKVKPQWLPKMRRYVNSYKKNEYMSIFSIL